MKEQLKDQLIKNTLCETCSNNVRIKYHGSITGWNDKDIRKVEPGVHEQGCFYSFTVFAEYKDAKGRKGNLHGNINVNRLIIDECSFYNRTQERPKKIEKPNISDDSDDSEKHTNGVTFVNIPGALLP